MSTRRVRVFLVLVASVALSVACDTTGGGGAASVDAGAVRDADLSPDGLTTLDAIAPGDAATGVADTADTSGADDAGSAVSPPLVVMTFNVLCSVCDPTFDPWDERLAAFSDIIARHDPDLMGLQEFIVGTDIDDFLRDSPGYEALWFASDGAFIDYPDATIVYRASRFELIDHGLFWLSPTPDVPGSVGFSGGAQLARLVVWAELRERATGDSLVFVTTHFDNNTPSQELSSPLVLDAIPDWIERGSLVVTGDFNSDPSALAYHLLVEGRDENDIPLVDTHEIASAKEIVSNADIAPPYDHEGRIDHVFVVQGHGTSWTCPLWSVDLTTYGERGLYPSDHWPVVVTLQRR